MKTRTRTREMMAMKDHMPVKGLGAIFLTRDQIKSRRAAYVTAWLSETNLGS